MDNVCGLPVNHAENDNKDKCMKLKTVCEGIKKENTNFKN